MINEDKTLSVALKQLYLNGFVGAGKDFNWAFKQNPNQAGFGLYNEAMNQAKGDITSAWPIVNGQDVLNYPRTASYKPNDFSCIYSCQSTEFFTYVAMAMMGTLTDTRFG